MTPEKRKCIEECLKKGMSQKKTAQTCKASLRDVNRINKWLEGRAELSNIEINKILFVAFRDPKYLVNPNGYPDLSAIVADTGFNPELVTEKYGWFLRMAKLDDIPEELKRTLTIPVPCTYCGEDIEFDVRNPFHRLIILGAFHHSRHSSYWREIWHVKCYREGFEHEPPKLRSLDDVLKAEYIGV